MYILFENIFVPIFSNEFETLRVIFFAICICDIEITFFRDTKRYKELCERSFLLRKSCLDNIFRKNIYKKMSTMKTCIV